MAQEEILKLHREAMALAERADEYARNDKADLSQELLRLALQKETSAANALTNQKNLEPTRSVLFRSAATLAIQCSEDQQAERLIMQGLAGNPPEEIRHELRSLMGVAKLRLGRATAAAKQRSINRLRERKQVAS